MKIIGSKATAALLCTGAIGLALFVAIPSHAQQATAKKAGKIALRQSSGLHQRHGDER